MYFSTQILYSLCPDASVYYKALHLSKSGSVHYTKVECFGRQNYQVFAEVAAENLSFRFEGTKLHGWNCSCQSGQSLCCHVAAAMASLDITFLHDPALLQVMTSTSSALIGLIDTYAKKQILTEYVPAAPAKLVPTMHTNMYKKQYLTFTIGAERQFVLKDIPQFIEAMETGAIIPYSKNFTLFHRMSSFEESCQPLVKFLLQNYIPTLGGAGSYTWRASSTQRRNFVLTSHMLDEFLHLMRDKPLIYCYSDGTELPLEVRVGNPILTLEVKCSSDGSYLLHLQNFISLLLQGQEHIYVGTGGNLYVCSESFSCATYEFLSLFSTSENLTILKQDMPAFCANVLQTIENFIEIASDSDLTVFEPMPLEASLYLDYPYDYCVTGAVQYRYGSLTFKGMTEPAASQGRNVQKEIFLNRLVQSYLPEYSSLEHLSILEDDEETVYRFLTVGLPELSKYFIIYGTDAFSGLKVRQRPIVQVGVRLRGDLLNLTFDTKEFDKKELADVLNSYLHQKRYHRLKDGSFLSLEDGSLSSLGILYEGLDLSDAELRSGQSQIPKFRALFLSDTFRGLPDLKIAGDEVFQSLIHNLSQQEAPALPIALANVLRPYQVQGYRWLWTLAKNGFGGILADDMGLGKTLQVLSFLQQCYLDNPTAPPSLVVCPSSLMWNWESEIEKFTPALRCCVVSGSPAQRTKLIRQYASFRVLITSYDLLKRDLEEYGSLEFYCQILDEAQHIKNHTTQNAKAVKQIYSRYRFALTGTPVENSLAELWSIFDFLMPGYLFSYSKFRRKYESPVVRGMSPDALTALKKLIAPFLLRRMKADVLEELPEKTETVLYTKMEPAQIKLYAAHLAMTKKEIAQELEKNGYNGSKLMILSMLTKLRQICCDPHLLYHDYTGGSAKLELCLELILSSVASGHKLVLFSQFTSMLQIIRQRLEEQGLHYYQITGETPAVQRLNLVNQFNENNVPIFLISLKAGGTGLNITGADIVIHYDPWWNMSAQNQATDRTHRIGQTHKVQVYRLIMKESIEEKIIKLQETKAQLADLVVQNTSLRQLTKKQLMELFL